MLFRSLEELAEKSSDVLPGWHGRLILAQKPDEPAGHLQGVVGHYQDGQWPWRTTELETLPMRARLMSPNSHTVRRLVDAGYVKPAGKITDQGRSSELDEGRDSSPATYSGR